ncbi:MAG TPA: TRAM domain-containing protein, partial [Streptosporangiaceae bacterium]|nr:TRAM domain-containing protein [Streptosporangiaceae bacterium]
MRARDVTAVTDTADGTWPDGGQLAPGDVVDLVAGEAVHGGWCVARLPAGHDGPGEPGRAQAGEGTGDGGSGRVVFLRHALPGERVRARITEITSRFARADAVEILAASADRVEPPCPYARPGGCGGCDWQHASLPAQRQLKASVVGQQLKRIAGLDRQVTVEPLPGDEDEPAGPRPGSPGGTGGTPGREDLGSPAGSPGPPGLGWRTRVRFTVRGDGVAGLRAHRSHEVIDVADCLIAHPGIRDIGVLGRRWPRATSVEAVIAAGSGERAVIVPRGTRSASWKGIAAESVLSAAARGGRATVLHGRSYLRQRAAGRSWRVSAGAFWQVHPGAADTLARAVLGALRPRPGDTALDLYCGAGLFAGVLAAAVGPGGAVVGIEADSAAARDARRNLRDMPWAKVYQGDAGDVIARRMLPAARLAVLDPPRTGPARDVIEYLATQPERSDGHDAGGPMAGERRVAYVS